MTFLESMGDESRDQCALGDQDLSGDPQFLTLHTQACRPVLDDWEDYWLFGFERGQVV